MQASCWPRKLSQLNTATPTPKGQRQAYATDRSDIADAVIFRTSCSHVSGCEQSRSQPSESAAMHERLVQTNSPNRFVCSHCCDAPLPEMRVRSSNQRSPVSARRCIFDGHRSLRNFPSFFAWPIPRPSTRLAQPSSFYGGQRACRACSSSSSGSTCITGALAKAIIPALGVYNW